MNSFLLVNFFYQSKGDAEPGASVKSVEELESDLTSPPADCQAARSIESGEKFGEKFAQHFISKFLGNFNFEAQSLEWL